MLLQVSSALCIGPSWVLPWCTDTCAHTQVSTILPADRECTLENMSGTATVTIMGSSFLGPYQDWWSLLDVWDLKQVTEQLFRRNVTWKTESLHMHVSFPLSLLSYMELSWGLRKLLHVPLCPLLQSRSFLFFLSYCLPSRCPCARRLISSGQWHGWTGQNSAQSTFSLTKELTLDTRTDRQQLLKQGEGSINSHEQRPCVIEHETDFVCVCVVDIAAAASLV